MDTRLEIWPGRLCWALQSWTCAIGFTRKYGENHEEIVLLFPPWNSYEFNSHLQLPTD